MEDTKVMNAEIITPVLSLDSVDSAVVNEMEPKDAEAFRMEKFSPEEIEQINAFADKIDLHDTNLIITYGRSVRTALEVLPEVTA